MNILIPHTWLLEHLETQATPTEIQKYLSLCGPSVERIYEREGDAVYDIEVTTNRVDCMSIRGIAREAAVILQQFGVAAKLKPLQSSPIKHRATASDFRMPTLIDDDHLSRRTSFLVLRDVSRATTPEWMAKRLRQVEMQVHDAVIDITNYVTHELGHPCHAFDYDRVMELGGQLVFTTAKKQQKFTTLDGVEYTTVGGEVVITNGDGLIIDLPSIKGLANTSISASTQNVLLFADNVLADKVRFASMTHAIRTTAAQLTEKNVDPAFALPVLEMGTVLFTELCGAKIASPLRDNFPNQRAEAPIRVPLRRVQDYLGIELPVNKIDRILTSLGCEVELVTPSATAAKSTAASDGAAKATRSAKAPKKPGEPTLLITPPSFRPDLTMDADVIEEVARIYGYHNLPSTLMSTPIPLNKPADTNFALEARIKRYLAAIGWQELYTYSLVGADVAEQSGHALDSHIKLQNPLTEDRVYLRRSVLPSLQEVIASNPTAGTVSLFELANVYHPQKSGLPAENLLLTGVSGGEYRTVRGTVEAILSQLFVRGVTIIPKPAEATKNTPYRQLAEVWADLSKADHLQKKNSKGGEHPTLQIGEIGILHSGAVGWSLTMADLLRVAHTHPSYHPAWKTSFVSEDLTFTLPAKTAVGEVISAIRSLDPVIRDVTLTDVYQQNFTFGIRYQSSTQNLTIEEIAPIRENLVKHILQQFQGVLVGTLASK